MIKAKNSQTKQLKFNLYKKYRKIIVGLLKKSKGSHYKNFFEDNKKIVKQFGTVSMKFLTKYGNINSIFHSDKISADIKC